MALPLMPLQNDEDVVELAQLTSAITQSVDQTRLTVGDFHGTVWTRGWHNVFERHLFSLTGGMYETFPEICRHEAGFRGRDCCKPKSMDAGMRGPDALQDVLRAFCDGLSKNTSPLVLQKLQFFTVSRRDFQDVLRLPQSLS